MSYDTFYAMVDQHDDLDAGIKSLALLFGREQAKIITILQIMFLIFLIIIGKKRGVFVPLLFSFRAHIALFHLSTPAHHISRTR